MPQQIVINADLTSLTWKAVVNNANVGTLNLIRDTDGLWFSECEVEESLRRRKIATQLVQKAIQDCGPVYFCSLEKEELIKEMRGYDRRYLTEDGQKLVKSLLETGVIKISWIARPRKLPKI